MVTIKNQKQDAAIAGFIASQRPRPVASAAVVKKFSDDTDLGRARIYERLRHLVKTGAIARVSKGRYRATGAQAPQPGQGGTKAEVMWRLLRSRRTVAVDDLVELAGVTETYARNFLAAMCRREAARRNPVTGKYTLTADTVAMPRDEEAAAKKRAARKQALAVALSKIRAACDDIEKNM